MQSETAGQANAARAAWMRVMALAQSDALDAAYSQLCQLGQLGTAAALPGYRLLRKPESGMAMVRARAGGTGAQFNLGEMSVTRCAVVLDESQGQPATAGVAYVQGRGTRHAEQAAVLDALLQLPAWHQRVMDIVITPLEQALTERAARQAATAAQTRVEFFTMVRGED